MTAFARIPANDDGICANILEQETPRFVELQRYLTDPAFKAGMDAETQRNRRRVQHEMDLFAIANFKGDDEPGFIAVARDRIAEFEGRGCNG